MIQQQEIDIENGVEITLPSVESEPKDNGRKKLSMVKEITAIEIAAGCLATISVATSIGAMIVAGSTAVNFAGILALLIGPYSYWQQRRITDIKALKETHEALLREVNILSEENQRLNGLVGDLGRNVEKLEDVENTLDYIQSMNIESVQEFKGQVEESRNILAAMRTNIKASAVQNVITVVLNSDKDGNYTLDPYETEALIENLKSINGMEMNEMKFRTIVSEQNGSINAVVQILQDIIDGDSNTTDGIFQFPQ